MILIFYVTKHCSSFDIFFGHLKMSKLSLAVRLSSAIGGLHSTAAVVCDLQARSISRGEKCEGGRQQGPGTCSTRSQLLAQVSPSLNWVRPCSQGEVHCPSRRVPICSHWMSIPHPPLSAPTYLDFNMESFLTLKNSTSRSLRQI